MSSDSKTPPIHPPQKHPRNRRARAVVRAAVGAVPHVGPALTEIADACLPDHEASDRDRWEGEITHGVNDLYDHVSARPTQEVTISGTAAELAEFLVKRCPDGLARDDVSREELLAAFPNNTRDELMDGLGILEMYGLVTSLEFMNDMALYTLTERAYEALDPPFLGWDTREDARRVAASAAEKGEYVLTFELEQAMGWPRRRFNPAHRLVVELINPAHVSEELQPQYVTPQFNPSRAEVARLRAFSSES